MNRILWKMFFFLALFSPLSGRGEPSSEEKQRAMIERYLDEAQASRGTPARANAGRRGYRYNSETGYSKEAASRSPAEIAPPPTREPRRSFTRSFQEEAPNSEPAAAKKPRWRAEEPVRSGPPQQKAKTEVSPNYPFEAQGNSPTNNFAQAFVPKGNDTRQALLNVKKWMRDGEEAQARTEAENDDDNASPPHDYNARIGLLGGLSTLQSGATSAASGTPAPANVFLGLFAQAHLGRYVGAEVEGFYGVAPKLTEVNIAQDGSTQSEVDRSVQHLGAMADINLRYAIPMGSLTFVPRVGIGYGLMSLAAKVSTATTLDTRDKKVSGSFWTVGVDIMASESFSLGIDYATSLAASGSAAENINGKLASQAIDGAEFNRLRIGAYVQVLPKVSLGAQYILRNLTAGSAGTANSSGSTPIANEGLSQILGVLMYQL